MDALAEGGLACSWSPLEFVSNRSLKHFAIAADSAIARMSVGRREVVPFAHIQIDAAALPVSLNRSHLCPDVLMTAIDMLACMTKMLDLGANTVRRQSTSTY